jgi:hypothetical protein
MDLRDAAGNPGFCQATTSITYSLGPARILFRTPGNQRGTAGCSLQAHDPPYRRTMQLPACCASGRELPQRSVSSTIHQPKISSRKLSFHSLPRLYGPSLSVPSASQVEREWESRIGLSLSLQQSPKNNLGNRESWWAGILHRDPAEAPGERPTWYRVKARQPALEGLGSLSQPATSASCDRSIYRPPTDHPTDGRFSLQQPQSAAAPRTLRSTATAYFRQGCARVS